MEPTRNKTELNKKGKVNSYNKKEQLMHTEIMDTRYVLASEIGDAVEDAMNDRNLIFNATSLRNVGFGSLIEISEAIERAMAICSCNGLPVKQHFKSIYISDCALHTLQRDWKLSKLAYTLTILNGACDNPAVARLQFSMLQKYMSAQRRKDPGMNETHKKFSDDENWMDNNFKP